MVSNHEDLIDNNPFKDEVAQEPAKPRTDRPLQMANARRPSKSTRKPPPIPQVEDHIINHGGLRSMPNPATILQLKVWQNCLTTPGFGKRC